MSSLKPTEQELLERLALVTALVPFTMLEEEHAAPFVAAHAAALEKAKEVAAFYAEQNKK